LALALEGITVLSERISQLEHQLSSLPLEIIGELNESIANHDQRLEDFHRRISAFEPNPRTVLRDLQELKSRSLAPSPSQPVRISPTEVKFPLKAAKSFHILLGNAGEMFTITELSPLLRSRSTKSPKRL
jgi:uncharacterized coiled-coil protein SlyX